MRFRNTRRRQGMPEDLVQHPEGWDRWRWVDVGEPYAPPGQDPDADGTVAVPFHDAVSPESGERPHLVPVHDEPAAPPAEPSEALVRRVLALGLRDDDVVVLETDHRTRLPVFSNETWSKALGVRVRVVVMTGARVKTAWRMPSPGYQGPEWVPSPVKVKTERAADEQPVEVALAPPSGLAARAGMSDRRLAMTMAEGFRRWRRDLDGQDAPNAVLAGATGYLTHEQADLVATHCPEVVTGRVGESDFRIHGILVLLTAPVAPRRRTHTFIADGEDPLTGFATAPSRHEDYMAGMITSGFRRLRNEFDEQLRQDESAQEPVGYLLAEQVELVRRCCAPLVTTRRGLRIHGVLVELVEDEARTSPVLLGWDGWGTAVSDVAPGPCPSTDSGLG